MTFVSHSSILKSETPLSHHGPFLPESVPRFIFFIYVALHTYQICCIVPTAQIYFNEPFLIGELLCFVTNQLFTLEESSASPATAVLTAQC